jgi:hypothetical protein
MKCAFVETCGNLRLRAVAAANVARAAEVLRKQLIINDLAGAKPRPERADPAAADSACRGRVPAFHNFFHRCAGHLAALGGVLTDSVFIVVLLPPCKRILHGGKSATVAAWQCWGGGWFRFARE